MHIVPGPPDPQPWLELSEIPIQPSFRRSEAREAHRALSLRVNAGEVVAVAGPPGFGGTTLARFAAGVARPESGHILVNGMRYRESTASRVAGREGGPMPVGFVPVEGGLLPHLTLRANITYGARLVGWTKPVIDDRLEVLAEKLELKPSLDLRPHEVSAGQRIRAALARVAMRHAQAPVLAVDATSGARGLADLPRMIERVWPSKASVLLCTVDADMIGRSDRVYLVGCGPKVMNGPTAKMRTSPPNLASAMVLLSPPVAVLIGTARGGKAYCDGVLVPVAAGVADGQHIVVVLGADSVEPVPTPDGLAAREASTDSLRLVSLVEPTARPGNRWSRREGSSIREWPVRLMAAIQPKPGVGVGLRIRADRVLVFDADSPGHPLLPSAQDVDP